jgi:Na+-translocating ferredoxin:NAD+ oxidoreductase subunit A
MTLLGILISAMMINNIVLYQFLGMSSFLGVSKKMESVVGLSLAVMVVTVVAAIFIYPLNTYVLEPLGLTYIQTIVSIAVIASVIFILDVMVKRMSGSLYSTLKGYLPFVASHSAILGIALLSVATPKSYLEAMVFALGSGLGYAMIVVTLTAIRMRLESYQVPQAFKGLPIALITAGLMALAILGLAGL